MSFTNICLCVAVLILCCAVMYIYRQYSILVDICAKQAMKLSEHESALAQYEHERDKILETLALCTEKIDKVNKKVEELPVEDMDARAKAEKAWDEGVQAIMTYGMELMKKDGTVNG